jgi:beta-glucanase (GH16 family)
MNAVTSRYVLLAGFLCAASLPQAGNAADQSATCDLKPVMLEEFDTQSIAVDRVGPARWTAHTPWSGDFGDAQFTNPGPDGPFSVRDGLLSITASKDASGKWRSGLIAAADATGAGVGARYGYFEVRMKMPPGPGTWPAFWLIPLRPADAMDGKVEIDVIEYYGHAPTEYHSVVHVWFRDEGKNRGDGHITAVPNTSLVEDFHTYGVDISPQELTFFLDGKPVWKYPAPPELDSAMYPLVNLALGSGWPIDKTPDPSTLLVDYVHVYARGAGPPEGCPAGPPPLQ